MESPLKNKIKKIYSFLNQGDEDILNAFKVFIFIQIIILLGLWLQGMIPK